MGNINKNKLSFIFLVLFVVFGAIYISQIKPAVQGDGREYILQTVAFQNHLSFGVTVDDFQQAQKEFYTVSDALETVYYSDNPMHPYKNARYSNHYGSYSALVMPVKVLIQSMGIYPLWAFTIVNFLLWIAALFVIFICLKAENKQKLCLIVLTIINPVVNYLDWTHSEMYLYSFTIIGMVFFYNKKYGKSIFFLSVAAMQNLGLLPFAMVVGIDLIIEKIINYKRENENWKLVDFLKKNILEIIPYGLCYIPGIIPIMSTYVKFHTFNLVADVATENKYLLHKALDYLFDLNLGILPFEGIILILFLLMAIVGIKNNRRSSLINICGVCGMLFVVSNQLQINCGMEGMMRYNIWIFPVMMFFVVMNFEKVFKTKSNNLIIIPIGLQVLATFVIIVGARYSYLEFAPWTEWILDKCPSIYNPSHGIFYSRVTHNESYYNELPVVYYNDKDQIRKILLSKEAETIFYSDKWELCDSDGNNINKKTLQTISIDDGDYKYVNVTGKIYRKTDYKLGDTIYLYTDRYNANMYDIKGISVKEDWGSWTDGEKVEFCIGIGGGDVKTIEGDIDVADTFYQTQNISLIVDDNIVYQSPINGETNISFKFPNNETGFHRIEILLPDAIRPSEVLNSMDTRKLGIGLRTIKFSKE